VIFAQNLATQCVIAYYLENMKLIDDFFADVDRKFFSRVRR